MEKGIDLFEVGAIPLTGPQTSMSSGLLHEDIEQLIVLMVTFILQTIYSTLSALFRAGRATLLCLVALALASGCDQRSKPADYQRAGPAASAASTTSSATSAAQAAATMAPTGDDAMRDLFRQELKARNLPVNVKGTRISDSELAKLWHSRDFELDGKRGRLFLTQTQQVDDAGTVQGGHAQAVNLSAAVYEQGSQGWVLKHRALDLTYIGAYGEAPTPDVKELKAPGVVLFLIAQADIHQGYVNGGVSVLAYRDGQMRAVGYIPTMEDNEGAALDPSERWGYTGEVSVLPGVRDFPDLQLKRSGTASDPSDSKRHIPVRDATFRYFGNRYFSCEEKPAICEGR